MCAGGLGVLQEGGSISIRDGVKKEQEVYAEVSRLTRGVKTHK